MDVTEVIRHSWRRMQMEWGAAVHIRQRAIQCYLMCGFSNNHICLPAVKFGLLLSPQFMLLYRDSCYLRESNSFSSLEYTGYIPVDFSLDHDLSPIEMTWPKAR